VASVAGDLVRQLGALSRIAHLSEPQMAAPSGRALELSTSTSETPSPCATSKEVQHREMLLDRHLARLHRNVTRRTYTAADSLPKSAAHTRK